MQNYFTLKTLKVSVFSLILSCFTITIPVNAITLDVSHELGIIAALITSQEQMLHYQALLDTIVQSNESPSVQYQLISRVAKSYKQLISSERTRFHQAQKEALQHGDDEIAQIYEQRTQKLDEQLAAVEQLQLGKLFSQVDWQSESSVDVARHEILKMIKSRYTKNLSKQIPIQEGESHKWNRENLDKAIELTVHDMLGAHPSEKDWKTILHLSPQDFLTNAHIMYSLHGPDKHRFVGEGPDLNNDHQYFSNLIKKAIKNASVNADKYSQREFDALADIVIAILNKDKFKSLPTKWKSYHGAFSTVELTVEKLINNHDINIPLIPQDFDLVIATINTAVKFAAIDPKIQALFQMAKELIELVVAVGDPYWQLIRKERHEPYWLLKYKTVILSKLGELFSSIANKELKNIVDVKNTLSTMNLGCTKLDKVIKQLDSIINATYKQHPNIENDTEIKNLFSETKKILEAWDAS